MHDLPQAMRILSGEIPHGAFAVAGAGSVLLLKYAAIVSLLTLAPPGKDLALVLFPMASRWSMVAALAAFPYARSQGLGSPFHQGNIWLATAFAGATAVAAAVLLGGIGGAAILLGVTGLAWLLGRGMANMLGGLTGDTYGAINELGEVAALGALVALIPLGWMDPLPQLLGVV